jgi:molybdopterin-guanine dinucleotide biosynthesis protein A
MNAAHTRLAAAPLWGLVLAGGDSSRMGEDKGAIVYRARSQAEHLHALLSAVCERSFVSINAGQAGRAPYAALPAIVDSQRIEGPAAGLLSAWARYPEAAWFVAAVDLVALDTALLNVLAGARQPAAAATVFRHRDGVLEPLLAIWEPRARAGLEAHIGRGDLSPRRYLVSADTAVVDCPRPEALRGANDPAERDRILADRVR